MVHSNLDSDKKALCIREGLFVYILLFLLISIGILCFIKKQTHKIPQKTISIQIVGAVSSEMTLQFQSGATVADLLAKVEHLMEADVDKLILDERLKSGRFIVPTKGKCSIWVEGQVEKSGLYIVPEGVRFNELLGLLPLKKEADSRYFTRKRRLVLEGETITVPKKC